jgi:ABC-type polysaccharide/polyol phosphate transport system ATPase subunit
MSKDIIISAENVGKKFCRSLKRTLTYGIKDVVRDVFGSVPAWSDLRRHEFWALKDVSFEVERGECLGVIGANGAGKSTLLKLLNGVILPDNGTIRVHGRVGGLLELGAGFHPMLTGRENIHLTGAILGLSKEEIENKIYGIIDFAEICDFIDTPVKYYSTGMYVRLGFSVAMSAEPEMLIIDEALAVGDVGFQQKCLHRIQTLRELGTTILFVTHDIQMLKNYCDSAAYLKSGKIIFHGAPEHTTEMYLKDMCDNRQRSLNGNKQVVFKRGIPRRTAFGTQHGKILDASLWHDELETNIFHQGELLKTKVTAWVDETVVNPEIVLQLRDLRGYTIYGTDSLSAGLTFTSDEREKGLIRVEFAFDVSLAAGEFAIALGLNDRLDDGSVILHEKLIGSLPFIVLEGVKKFHGAVDLNARCERSQSGTAADSMGLTVD